MKKTDKERLKMITEIWAELSTQILNDEFLQWAVTTPLYNIGEQVYLLSSTLKERYSELPWNMVSGLRHRLVHDYDGINWTIIVEVIFEDMEIFAKAVEQILNEM